MYQPNCKCNAVAGLGLVPELLTVASALTGGGSGGGSGGGGGAMMPQQTTVSPQISTQISPQISPNFQQQFQPQNSAMTAGTSQSLPAMPAMNSGMPGTVPDYGSGMPGYAPQPFAPAVPSVPINLAQYMPYALAGLGILAFVTLKKRGVKKAS